MRKQDIKVGRAYKDSRENIREVIADGPQLAASVHASQINTDLVRFKVVSKAKSGGHRLGFQANVTRASFAAWAKEEVRCL